MINNDYNTFRDTRERIGDQTSLPNSLSKRYDEPTYMTFRVMFGKGSARWNGTTLVNTNYDRMPHPLFINKVVDSTKTSGTNNRSIVEFNRDSYSTRDFLRDSNEFTRAEMLKEFITTWEDLQDNYQWYFQSVEGLNDLLTVTPEKGKRVGQDVRLTFKMLESVDHRVSYLLNLYRKIAWDDTYQRWVLPDLMRFFDIQILVTEFRTFHRSTVTPNSGNPVYLNILNGILPTYMIECQMCEFDINSFDFSYRSKLSVIDNPELSTISFKVKVGNINEITTYPLFYHYIFNDYALNGFSRSKEMGTMKDLNGRITNETVINGDTEILVEKEYASTRDGDARYASLDQVAQNTFFVNGHISGYPYIQSTNKNTLFGATGEPLDINPTEPATWVGNAITFGKSFTVNFVTQKIDKAAMTNIPGLGFSYNDATAAIESKSFVSVLALIRRAIAESVGGTEPPSGLLNTKIDATFKEFLIGMTQSEATDGDQLELVKFANMTLNNRGTWEQVKDLSYATDLKGPGETNIPVKVDGRETYKQQIKISTNGQVSKATGGGLINVNDIQQSSTVSSATDKHRLEGAKYVTSKDRSLSTDLDGGPRFFKTGTIIEAAPSSATSGKKLDIGNLQNTGSISMATSVKVETDKTIAQPSYGSTDVNELDGGKFKAGTGLGNKVTSDFKTTNIRSEATDKDQLDDAKISQPKSKSEATDKKI